MTPQEFDEAIQHRLTQSRPADLIFGTADFIKARKCAAGVIDAMMDEDPRCAVAGITYGSFKDDISRREYIISGMCQACQDEIFQGDN